jgi:hypothetical protein
MFSAHTVANCIFNVAITDSDVDKNLELFLPVSNSSKKTGIMLHKHRISKLAMGFDKTTYSPCSTNYSRDIVQCTYLLVQLLDPYISLYRTHFF